MRYLLEFVVVIAVAFFSYKVGGWRTETFAISAAKNEMRNTFVNGFYQEKKSNGEKLTYWPTNLKLPIGCYALYDSKQSDIELFLGEESEEALFLIKPIFHKDKYVVIYRNGLTYEYTGDIDLLR